MASRPEVTAYGDHPSQFCELLEGTPDEVPQRYATASPLKRLPIGVPMLVVHAARRRPQRPVIVTGPDTSSAEPTRPDRVIE